ncbi:MAG: glycerol-3-phosphate 1-O-acyltransferase PlsY [Proteobacteria bacterium]|nr:glycerol-3-phosphate 1-O-acyltransferase PlsY [Pseudomonadota bacterium]
MQAILLILILLAYLLGSVPFGLVFARLAGKGDPRASGSGNIGATNVARTAGWAPGLATLAADAAKAALPAAAAAALTSPESPWTAAVALAAFLGHLFPVYSKFKGGGKGVASAAGGLAVLSLPALGACMGAFALFTALSGRVSVGSLTAAALLFPALAISGAGPAAAAAGAVMAALMWVRHAENLRRLAVGTEPRMFGKHRKP